jgi:hypothetical protein
MRGPCCHGGIVSRQRYPAGNGHPLPGARHLLTRRAGGSTVQPWLGRLRPEADSAEAFWLRTVVLSGLMSQQMAKEPGVPVDEGRFSRLTDVAIEMFLSTYRA